MYVKQISVYLENIVGSLQEVVELLGKNSINLLALSVADTSGFGIVRVIVKSDDVQPALDLLKANGFIAKLNHILCVQVPHKPLGFAEVLALLGENGLSVEYCYSFCKSTSEDAVMLVRPSDTGRGGELLKEKGITLLSQEQVDTF